MYIFIHSYGKKIYVSKGDMIPLSTNIFPLYTNLDEHFMNIFRLVKDSRVKLFFT